MIRAVVFDLDGVIRHFPTDGAAAIERRHGLLAGAIPDAAFAPDLLDAVITGRCSRAKWIARVGERIGDRAAAEEWGRMPARVDPDALALADRLRASGVVTAILTNGTDTVPIELAELGIDAHFDHVFNSAEIGVAKPDVQAFGHALLVLDADPADVFFTDDSSSKLAGAQELGMPVHHFHGVDGLLAELRVHGVLD